MALNSNSSPFTWAVTWAVRNGESRIESPAPVADDALTAREAITFGAVRFLAEIHLARQCCMFELIALLAESRPWCGTAAHLAPHG